MGDTKANPTNLCHIFIKFYGKGSDSLPTKSTWYLALSPFNFFVILHYLILFAFLKHTSFLLVYTFLCSPRIRIPLTETEHYFHFHQNAIFHEQVLHQLSQKHIHGTSSHLSLLEREAQQLYSVSNSLRNISEPIFCFGYMADLRSTSAPPERATIFVAMSFAMAVLPP